MGGHRIVLCVSDNPPALLLYQSMLELEGYSVLPAQEAKTGIELSRVFVVDCAVIDHAADGTVLAAEIGEQQAGPPLIFVHDGSEMPLQIYPQVEMFINRDEAVEALPRCIDEVLDRRGNKRAGVIPIEPTLRGRGALPLHSRFVTWILPW